MENLHPTFVTQPFFFLDFLSEDIFLGNSHIYPPDPANYVLGTENLEFFSENLPMLRGNLTSSGLYIVPMCILVMSKNICDVSSDVSWST